jgi:hypothetical protein
MSPLFSKLNLKEQTTIHVLNAPQSFESELGALQGVNILRKVTGKVTFALAFVVTQKDLDTVSAQLIERAEGDAVLWLVYPKGSSKKYTCEFNRDSGWSVLKAGGYDTVRQVAIDEDWSALRFRKAENITFVTRPAGAVNSKLAPATNEIRPKSKR